MPRVLFGDCSAAGISLAAHRRHSRIGARALGLIALACVLASCGGDDGDRATEYVTLNYPLAAPGGSTLLTGVRGVDDSADVFISGFYASPAPDSVDTGLIYKGPATGGGTWYTLNYPSSPGATVVNTALYGPNNDGAGGVTVVGNYTTEEAGAGTPIGLLYQGPLDGSGTWQTLDPPDSNGTIAHSNMGGLIVGNYVTQGAPTGHAFVYDIESDTYSELVKPGAVSITAYGIWHNGGSSYTIAGGYTELGHSTGYLVDWNSAARTASNWTSFKYKNAEQEPALLSHFEGITSDGDGGYNLASDLLVADTGLAVQATFVHVPRTASGSFGEAMWTDLAYPDSTLTSANTVYQRIVLGIYQTGTGVSSGYVATVP